MKGFKQASRPRHFLKLWWVSVLVVFNPPLMAAPQECVVLLHGLARTSTSMKPLEKALIQQKYYVVNRSYPSREKSIQTLADEYVSLSVAACPKEFGVHFVTHSMGGILVRQYLSVHELARLKRVVMLGPPNQGSEVIDSLGDFPGFEFMNGEAGLQLGTGEVSVPNTLGPATFDVGVVAGTRSINLVLSQIIPGPDDGKVSVEHTKLEGMGDHITLPVTHTFMMKNTSVVRQVLHYLKHGKFHQPKPSK